MADFDLHIVNPRKRKKTAKKKASKKKSTRKPKAKTAKKGTNMAGKKKKTPRRRRRRNPAPAAPARRRRRKSTRTANPRRRRRRTSNPMGLGAIPAQVKKFLPRFAGKLAVAFVTKRLGYGGGIFGGSGSDSDLGGTSWNWKQYGAAIAVAMYGPKLFGKFVNGAEFAEGAWDLILTKLVWTEGIARSEWAVNNFGDGEVQYDSSTGHMLINQGGQYVAMQGGTLVEASALDGGTLVEASALDGETYYPGEVIPVSGHASSYDSSGVYGS